MTGIRPFVSSDVDAVARLYEVVMRSGRPSASAAVAGWLRRVLLAQPWADEDIPSLVATGPDGEVVGFIASHVRRLHFDGRPVRMACSGQLTVDVQARSRGTGARLIAAFLAGAQDLTITDGATEQVSLIWERLGGERAPMQQLTWVRPVAPWRHPLLVTAEATRLLRGREARDRFRHLPPVTPIGPGLTVEKLTAEALLAALPELTARLRLAPSYDLDFLGWLLAELPRAGLGTLRAALIHRSDGRAVGYYAYYARPGAVSDVICLAAPTDDAGETVLCGLLRDASACGVAAVRGRVEPRLLNAVAAAKSLLLRRSGALVHSRDPELLHVATSKHALLSRLEGEWCLRPQAL